MTKQRETLAFRCVIPNTGNPISFAGGEDEAGVLRVQFYASGDEIEKLLSLRGKELIIALQEA